MEREKMVRNGLLVVAALLGLFLVLKMVPKLVLSKNVRMTLTRNRESIQSMTNARNPDFTWTAKISRIEFPEGTELFHPDRGPLGYQNDFFLDLVSVMTVRKEGTYVFGVASDDGFRLSIDDRPVGDFPTSRPYTTNFYSIYVKKGTYPYQLSYYQGYGRLGLKATYKSMDDPKTFVIGQDSSLVRFRTQ